VFLGPVLLAVGYALLSEWAALRSGIEVVTRDDVVQTPRRMRRNRSKDTV